MFLQFHFFRKYCIPLRHYLRIPYRDIILHIFIVNSIPNQNIISPLFISATRQQPLDLSESRRYDLLI